MRLGVTLILTLALVSAAAADDFAKDRDKNWPAFRGPRDNGVAPLADPPSKWSETENVKWKTEIPGRGNSTPVIWGNRVFLLTAVPTGKKVEAPKLEPGAEAKKGHPQVSDTQDILAFNVVCVDRATGKVAWSKTVRQAHPHQGTHQKGSYASSTPVTDGERLYASFGTQGLYCFDFEGNQKWKEELGKIDTRLAFGEGSSPTLYGDMLILCIDHEGQSYLIALDKMTGKRIWKKLRTEKTNWSSPVVIEHEGKAQIVVSATGRVRGYDLKTGEDLWQCGGQTLNTIPMVVSSDGIVVAMSGFRANILKAIKLGQTGDLTDKPEALAWEAKKGTPYVPSPILYGDELYVLNDKGILSNFEMKTGKENYLQSRLPGSHNYTSSLLGAADRVYMVAEDGAGIVVKKGKTFEVIGGENKLDGTFYSSPVAVDKELFLRSETHLYCIAEK